MDLKDVLENRGILYFAPEYEEGLGSVTQVVFENGEQRKLCISVKTFLKNICRYYAVDKESSRIKYGALIGSVNCVPLPLCSNLLLVQLKVRVPKIKGDGAMAYINYIYIRDYEKSEESKAAILRFKGNVNLKVLCDYKTVVRHMNNAQLIYEQYKKEKSIYCSDGALGGFYLDMDKPATKSDIAFLAREVISLKNCLKLQ